MLQVDEALARVLAVLPELPVQRVGLGEAHGRVLAEDVVAPSSVPPWDNSAMDGFAVRAGDTAEGEVRLRLLEVVGAGRAPSMPVEPGTATAVMTGAPVPEGADAVVMIEHTDRSLQGEVRVRGQARPGQHIRRRGEDVARGATVLQAGQRLTPAAVGLLAAVGVAEVSVRRPPRVAILSTGDELRAPGQALGPGQIHASNGFALAGLALQAGAVPRDLGAVPDDEQAIRAALHDALQDDAVITTGGVSVGAFDVVREVLQQLSGDIGFWKVRMKPGKPFAFGRASRDGRSVPLFGLPGNPVSCMVGFLQFVRPWLRRVQGDPRPFLPVVQATLSADLREKPGRVCFARVVLEDTPEGLRCHPAGSQSSAALSAMSRSTGLALLPAEPGGARAGEVVRVQVLDPGFLDRADPGYPW